MTTYHIYGRMYGRFDEQTFEGTITDDKLKTIVDAVATDNDDVMEDYFDEDYDIAALIIGGLTDDAFDFQAVLDGGAASICIEEFAGGVGPTLRDAKIAFVDAE